MGWLATALYAVVRSSCAWIVVGSLECSEPLVTTPGRKPVIAVPGLTPTSPLAVVGPVLTTVVPARTAKLPAAPSEGAVAAAQTPTHTIKKRVAAKQFIFCTGWESGVG